ncbi:MAG: 30S ribosomal protein S3 [Oscillospiraceae bacterium]|nr:30S ribosomal protein S3 [Oscillospiraceae bacterium]
MGQKVNPHGLRVGIIKNWDSRWFVKNSEFGKTLVSDYNLRKFLKKKLFLAGVPKIEIERDNQRARVIIHCAKPGLVIGRGGNEIDKLRPEIEKILDKPVSVNIVELKYPDMHAQLVAEKIGEQLERRISFRRAMKQSIAATMRLGAKGIKIAVSGLLGGADIARTEHYHEGTIPLQTIRADIDYGQHAALTKMGLIGIKVWIYKGEVLTKVNRDAKSEADRSKVGENIPQRRERRDRFDRDGGDKGNFARPDRPYQQNRDNNRQQGGGRGRFNGPPAPPSNFGNRKSFDPKAPRPQKPAEPAVEAAPEETN